MAEKLGAIVLLFFSVLYIAYWLICLKRLVFDIKDGITFYVQNWETMSTHILSRNTEPLEEVPDTVDIDFSCGGWDL